MYWYNRRSLTAGILEYEKSEMRSSITSMLAWL